MTDERSHRRGTDPLPGHVADHHQPVAVHLPELVEIATHVALPSGGPVEGRDLPLGQLRQRFRQQAVLQRAGDLRALAVEPCVLDGQRGALADLHGELDV